MHVFLLSYVEHFFEGNSSRERFMCFLGELKRQMQIWSYWKLWSFNASFAYIIADIDFHNVREEITWKMINSLNWRVEKNWSKMWWDRASNVHGSILTFFLFCLPSIHNTIELMRTDHNNHSLNDQMAKIGKRGELVDFSFFSLPIAQFPSLPIAFFSPFNTTWLLLIFYWCTFFFVS